VRMNSKGQVTIPANSQERHGLHEGDVSTSSTTATHCASFEFREARVAESASCREFVGEPPPQ
jgi:hypothetical protein